MRKFDFSFPEIQDQDRRSAPEEAHGILGRLGSGRHHAG